MAKKSAVNKQERSLERFISKRNEWLEHFAGEDENSITNQLYDLVWNTAVFRVINKSRSFALNDNGTYENCAMVHGLINKCFSEYQFIAIRRLLDHDKDRTYSLYALICDMEKNFHLITRLNYFKAYDVEYDVEKVKKQHDEYVDKQASGGNKAYSVPAHLIYRRVERMHTVFDILSNTKSDDRKTTDNVPGQFFGNLRNKLDKLEDIITYAHKFIAHLARPDDRRKNDVDKINITLGKIWGAHEVICKVATLIGKLFLEGCGGFLGTTQFDQFKNIDKPIVETENVAELISIWYKYLKETDSWAYFDIENYNDFIKNGEN